MTKKRNYELEFQIINHLCDEHEINQTKLLSLLKLEKNIKKDRKKFIRTMFFLNSNRIINTEIIYNFRSIEIYYSLSIFYKDVGLYKDMIECYDNIKNLDKLAEILKINNIIQDLFKKYLITKK